MALASTTSTQYGGKPRVVVSGSIDTIGTATKVAIETSGTTGLVQVYRLKLKRTAGSGTNLTPKLFSTSGATAGSAQQQFVGSATAIADLFDVACTGVYFQTDATGKFYLAPTPDAGADNAYDIELVYEVL